MKENQSGYMPLIEAARRNTPVYALSHYSRYSQEVNQSYELTMKKLEFLLEKGLVKIEDGHLALGELGRSDWLTKSLLEGNEDAWALSDIYSGNEKKFDPDLELMGSVGLQGEMLVLEKLRRIVPSHLHGQIRHTSLTDDRAGFDIQCPINTVGDIGYLEIKSTTRPGDRFRFFLSRNEWVKSNQLKHWFLVLVQISPCGGEVFGHLESRGLIDYMPRNVHQDFAWESTRGVFAREHVLEGLPVRF